MAEFIQTNQGGIIGTLFFVCVGYFMLSQMIGKNFDKYIPHTATPEERDKIKKENFINRLKWPYLLFKSLTGSDDST